MEDLRVPWCFAGRKCPTTIYRLRSCSELSSTDLNALAIHLPLNSKPFNGLGLFRLAQPSALPERNQTLDASATAWWTGFRVLLTSCCRLCTGARAQSRALVTIKQLLPPNGGSLYEFVLRLFPCSRHIHMIQPVSAAAKGLYLS
jgi:hypothetical protein